MTRLCTLLLSLALAISAEALEPPTLTAYYLAPGPNGPEYVERVITPWERVPSSTYGLEWTGQPEGRLAGAWWDQMSGAWVYVCLDGEELGPHGLWTGPIDQLRPTVEAWWNAKGER